MKNSKVAIIIAVSSLMLFIVGCGSDENNNVQSEEVVQINDTSYYDEIKVYNTKLTDFLTGTYREIQSKNVTDENKDALIKITNDFLLYSQTFNPIPITTEDNLLDEHYDDIRYYAETIAEYTLDYIYKRDDVYLKFHKNAYQDLLIHTDTAIEIEKRYF